MSDIDLSKKNIDLESFKRNINTYIDAVRQGKEFTVVENSTPIFKLVPVDEYGDEGSWETVIDFTEINPRGVPATEVLKALDEIISEQ